MRPLGICFTLFIDKSIDSMLLRPTNVSRSIEPIWLFLSLSSLRIAKFANKPACICLSWLSLKSRISSVLPNGFSVAAVSPLIKLLDRRRV